MKQEPESGATTPNQNPTMSSLYDFEDTEPPTINEEKPVRHPYRQDVILGFAGVCPTRDNAICLNVQRYRHGDTNNKQDYYRKVGGYSMTKRTIEWLSSRGAELVFIEETDNDRLVEYQIGQFQNGETVMDVQGEPQWCCSVDMAVHTWSRSETTINHATGR